jgi:hypothetical protein
MKKSLKDAVNTAFNATGPAALQVLMLEIAERVEAIEAFIAPAAPQADPAAAPVAQ